MRRALRQTYLLGGRAFDAALRFDDGRLLGIVTEDGEAVEVDIAASRVDGTRVRLDDGEERLRATVVRKGDVAWVAIDGHTYEVGIEEPGAGGAHHAGEEDFAVSPMTGVVAKVAVRPGETVGAGDELFVVEAMKMEYVVKAPRELTIAEVRSVAGDSVEQGVVVVTFAEAGP